MEKKEKQSSGGHLLPILLVCMLLACAGLVFAIYTHRELSWLKTQIREHEKLIQTLQLSNNARDIQGSKEAVRIRRSARDSCTCVGDRGADGAKGTKGSKGLPGFDGYPGKKGEPGNTGDRGADGAKGTKGSKGLPGLYGFPGMTGEPGDTGPQGHLGSVTHESIHLVGNGLKIHQSNGNSRRVTNWVQQHREGNILYNRLTGHIVVKKTGFYFIYSQMFYYDASATYMAHATFINDEKVMGSTGSVINSKKFLNTKYHGGVFLLRENDTISVHISFRSNYYMTSRESFFGAFWLGRVTQVLSPPTTLSPVNPTSAV